MKTIDALNWRYATKKFNPDRKISKQDLEKLREAVNLAPTSYGLQLFKVLEIENPELRARLREASWGQTQITDASQMWVFCSYRSHKPEDVLAFSEKKAAVQGLPAENARKYAEFINNSLAGQSEEAFQNWTAKQTYIALGGLMIACAELGIDSCPMEGFSPEQYDEILGLSEQNLKAAVVVTMGYRSKEDTTALLPKVRKELSHLFDTI